MVPPDPGRRKDIRVKARLKVRFKDARAFIAEYTHNISKGGLFIRTGKPSEIGDQVEVVILLPGSDEEITCIGEVIHVVGAAEASANSPAGMGLHLGELSAEDKKEIEEFIEAEVLARDQEGHVDRRRHVRYETRIRVRFGSKEAMIEEYTHNISHGGIFIQTENPKPLNDRLLIILTHPDTKEEMMLHGEVVRIVDVKESRTFKSKPGMGVRFLEMDEVTRRQLASFISSEHVKKP